jgi:hypothetical protein
MLPLLKLARDSQPHTLGEAVDYLANEYRLSEDDRNQLLQSGQTRLYNRVGWSTTYLKKAGLLHALGPGRFQITARGREVLAASPPAIDIAFLESRFPEMAEFRRTRQRPEATGEEEPATFDATAGIWNQRPGIEERVRETLQLAIPSETTRHAALSLLALAIDVADEERDDAWYLRETDQGLRLMAGRLLVCEVRGSRIRMSVLGPVGEDVRTALGSDAEADEEFKSIAGGLLLTFPPEHAPKAAELLKQPLVSFIEQAVARVRSRVALDDHTPEAVVHIASEVGRDLPQPHPAPEVGDSSDHVDSGADSDDPGVSRQPCVRGRAPIFEHGQRAIASLMSDIERGVIALPDLQRPFVWEDTKVRDLLDSLFLGFPVGTLVLWHTSAAKDARALATEVPGLRATTLVIDGQQRLSSLFAVMRGVDIVGKDGSARRITIAFRPRDGRFEVADAAIRKDPEYLSSVTELWDGKRSKPQIRRDLLDALRDKGRAIDPVYEDAAERNLDRAHSISDYRFPTVDIRRTAATHDEEANEEDVAEIFVRINNQGKRLGQADFVLTLLSVFHEELRDRIEDSAREMSNGAIVALDTQQLLRAACAVAFGRARMAAVYRYLRGIDPTTREEDTAGREKRLQELDQAASDCIASTTWRDYLLRVKRAGFVSSSQIASKNAIVNAYALYIRGRKAGVPKAKLDDVVARWLFGSLLTARYSGSSETVFEEDLARLARVPSGDTDGFVSALDQALDEALTGDYWTHSLVATLETQKARAPAALAFRAAQVVLGARALFSDQPLQNLLDPPASGARAASETHHLFPEDWLRSRGVHDRRRINQVANLADTGWHENNWIRNRGPADYVPRLREKLLIDDDRWGRLCAEHALPSGWEAMEYEAFLPERRRRMADVIRVAYRHLGGEADAPPVTPPWFLPGAEVVWQRIGEAERALRRLVREVYGARFGQAAGKKLEEAIPVSDRGALERALRSRPAGSDPLSIVDYLYLAQLPGLLFSQEAWHEIRQRLAVSDDPKRRLQSAVSEIAPVRNEIAHVREVPTDRLLRAAVACTDVLALVSTSFPSSEN